MASLSNIEVGSIVYNLISNIPTGISGLLVNGFLTNQAVYIAENFTGNDISTSAIIDAYQPAIISLTISNVLSLMESQGIGTKSVSIGELSVTKGMVDGTSESYKKVGLNLLTDLGYHISTYQCWG